MKAIRHKVYPMPDVKNAFIFFIRPYVRPIRQGNKKRSFISKTVKQHMKKKKKKKIETHGWLSTTVSVLKRAIVIAPRNVIENMHIRGIHLCVFFVSCCSCLPSCSAVAYGNGISLDRWVEDFTLEIRKRLRVIIKGDSMENNLLLPFVF